MSLGQVTTEQLDQVGQVKKGRTFCRITRGCYLTIGSGQESKKEKGNRGGRGRSEQLHL